MVDTAASYKAGVKLVQTRRMLRYAAHFHKKFPKKNFKKNSKFLKIFCELGLKMLGRLRVFIEKLCLKKISKKKSPKKISKKKNSIFFFSFFWLSVFRSQFGACLPKFGLSRPAGLGGDRDCTNST
jgi:hypothetical protein